MSRAEAVRGLASDSVNGGSLRFDGGHASRLSREQRGRFVATCWTAQMFQHFDDPGPGYVADWPHLPAWQRETDADIFDAIEKG